MKILIVDDDPQMRTLLKRVLHEAGHATCWAASGPGAMRLIQGGEHIDLVILDITLEGQMTGYDVARQLPRGLPLIILSGMLEEEVRAGARAIDNALREALTILGKPLNVAELIRIVKHAESADLARSADTNPRKQKP